MFRILHNNSWVWTTILSTYIWLYHWLLKFSTDLVMWSLAVGNVANNMNICLNANTCIVSLHIACTWIAECLDWKVQSIMNRRACTMVLGGGMPMRWEGWGPSQHTHQLDVIGINGYAIYDNHNDMINIFQLYFYNQLNLSHLVFKI